MVLSRALTILFDIFRITLIEFRIFEQHEHLFQTPSSLIY